MFRGAAGSPQLAHREGVRVSIVTSSKRSPGIPNGRRSCVLGFKANKLGLSRNAQRGAGVTLHGAVRGAGTPVLLRAHARFTGPRRSPAWQPGGGGSGTGWGCCASAPRPSRRRRRCAVRRLPGRGQREPRDGCGQRDAGSARLRGAGSPWGTPSITAQSVSPPCPSPTCPSASAHHHPARHHPGSERADQSQAEILGVGIANSAQTPVAKHFQMSGVWGPLRAERGDPLLSVGWQRSPAADHLPPREMQTCHLQTSPRILKTKRARVQELKRDVGRTVGSWLRLLQQKKAAMVKNRARCRAEGQRQGVCVPVRVQGHLRSSA